MNNPQLPGRGETSLQGSSIEKGSSPTKSSNGMYIYSQEKAVNQVLNAVSNYDIRNGAGTLKEVAGFKSNGTITGVFSSPQGGAASGSLGGYIDGSGQPLTEDELNVISDFEEETLRLGNFERIFPLQQNCVHY